jgi:hypothetical protein
MATKDVAEMTAQVLAHLKTGKFCNDYPMPGSNFTKEKMDAAKAAGVGKGLPAPKKGKVKLGGKVI